MNPIASPLTRSLSAAFILAAFLPASAFAADAPAMSASELASRLSAARADGSSYVRLKMETTAGSARTALQLQIKQRATKAGTDIVYQVLWPKERKGESILLRKSGGRSATGSVFRPPDTVQSLSSSDMKDPLLGSNLSYEDIIDDFFDWDTQTLKGTEAVDRVNCQILESKPGKAHSSYGKVLTWVDTRRLVPMKIEKYSSSGQLLRRIETTKVATDDNGRVIPANLSIHGSNAGSVTELDGSKIRHDIAYTDRDFSPEGLRDVAVPKSAD